MLSFQLVAEHSASERMEDSRSLSYWGGSYAPTASLGAPVEKVCMPIVEAFLSVGYDSHPDVWREAQLGGGIRITNPALGKRGT